MKYRLIPKDKKKLSETAATLQPPATEIQKNPEINENLNTNEIEKFNGPKDAIKWCNKMFEELKDIKYKQISNYLHIYI